MKMTPEEYQQYVQKQQPKSPVLKDTVLAFVIALRAVLSLLIHFEMTHRD